MKISEELEVLLEKGYDNKTADSIRKLIDALNANKALAGEFEPVAEGYAKDPFTPSSGPLEKIAE